MTHTDDTIFPIPASPTSTGPDVIFANHGDGTADSGYAVGEFRLNEPVDAARDAWLCVEARGRAAGPCGTEQ
jgi:hypothetical protein